MKMSMRAWTIPVIFTILILGGSSVYAIVFGQIDDFEDGTTQNWGPGFSPNPPVNIPDGGPLGVGDNYLEITSTGVVDTAGSRLISFNLAQWLGDYPSNGVSEITMDVNNLGAVPLDLRVSIDGPGGTFSSTSSIPLPVGSGWTTVIFPVTPTSFSSVLDFSAVPGFDVTATLGGVFELRILSSSVPSWFGDTIDATLGVDNIVAGLVAPNPEIGGTLIPIDTTALLIAGAQTMTPWLILGVLSAVGIGLAVFTLKRSH